MYAESHTYWCKIVENDENEHVYNPAKAAAYCYQIDKSKILINFY